MFDFKTMFDLTPYEIYIFVLCMIVFVLLTALFIILFSWIMRLLVRGIREGLEDLKILKEYKKYRNKKLKTGLVDILITVLFCTLSFGAFGFSIYTSIYANDVITVPMYRAVLSASMAKKYEENEHLFENDLNDQFDRFDLILTHPLPAEEDLQLYDIVVYEIEETLVVHRIVGIEEPNEKHSNERWFMLQGDAVETQDRFPVLYSQMRAIYKGERIPFLGSFIAFMRSPAGFFCIVLIVFGVVAIPHMEKKLYKERRKRLLWLMENDEEDEYDDLLEESEPQTGVYRASEGVYCCCPFACPYYTMYYMCKCANCQYAREGSITRRNRR